MAFAHAPFVAAGFGKKKPPTHPINVNNARSAELQNGAGDRAVDGTENPANTGIKWGVKGVNDLLAIRGIREKWLEKTNAGAAPKKGVAPTERADESRKSLKSRTTRQFLEGESPV